MSDKKVKFGELHGGERFVYSLTNNVNYGQPPCFIKTTDGEAVNADSG